ncbi:unnamed protein product, partial [Brassica napus]
QINNGGQFREFFLKCVNAGNTRAICYAGLHAATSIGLEEKIQTTYFAAPKTGPELQFALEPATEGLESANDPATEGLESVNEPATEATPEALELATEPPMTESPTTVL